MSKQSEAHINYYKHGLGGIDENQNVGCKLAAYGAVTPRQTAAISKSAFSFYFPTNKHRLCSILCS